MSLKKESISYEAVDADAGAGKIAIQADTGNRLDKRGTLC